MADELIFLLYKIPRELPNRLWRLRETTTAHPIEHLKFQIPGS